MSLTILLAHTGAQLKVDPRSLNSLDSLRSWIARNSEIPANGQILMTGRGKPVKLQNLLTEKEIFVYDRDLLSPRAPGQLPNKSSRPIPSPYVPQQAPDELSDQTSLEAWQRLFKERYAWAVQIARACNAMIQKTSDYSIENDVIRRATVIASANPKQHIDGLHHKYEEAEKWVTNISQDQAKLVAQADHILAVSKNVKTYNALIRVVAGSSTGSDSGNGTLEPLLNKSAIDAAKKRAIKAITNLRQKLQDVQSSYDDVVHDGEDLIKQVNTRLSALSEDITGTVDTLTNEMEACVIQIKADYENTMQAHQDTRGVAAVSKTALLHTKKFLPTLYDVAIDVGELLRRTADRRNSVEEMALHFLQRTAAVESSLASVQSQMRTIDLEADDDAALEVLGRAVQMPAIYGSLLVEVVRRQEWNQKMITDTSTLAEEMATYREDEEKRRKKWQKSVEDFLTKDALSTRARIIEINLSGQEQFWPNLSRDDITVYMQELEALGGFEDTLQEINVSIKALEQSSKTQAKKSNAFRNGALSESAFGRNSLLLRGDDDLVTSLQNDKAKLEDRLRSSESRIRKLEDVLHRSNSMARPFASSSGQTGSQAPGMERNRSGGGIGYPLSPRLNDSPSRRSSVASNRLSLNQALDEDNILQRVLQLETDLAAERKKSATFEESTVKHGETVGELKRQIDDAATMKTDLMANFQTRQQEFDAERKLLEDELKKFKIRMEEMEEEYERVLGSHDNTRGAYSVFMKEHEETIETMRTDAQKDMQQALDRIGNLQSIKENQHDRLESLEEELSKNARVMDTLRKEIKEHVENREVQHEILQSAHKILDPDTSAPSAFSELVIRLESLSQRAQDQNKDLRLVTEAMKIQNDSLETRLQEKDREMSQLRQTFADNEKELTIARERSATGEAKANALEQELQKERETLQSVRAQLPGSETIKFQLADAEKRAENLSLQLASSKATNVQSENELQKHHKAVDALQVLHDTANNRLHERARRAAEVSLLLYLQTDRLTRLLEHIGFSVSREDDAMVVQRITRTTSAGNTTTVEAPQNMTRSLSGPGPRAEEHSPPEYLHWAAASDVDIERQFFEDFVHESKAFDLDAFCDAVVKRIKDTEHIARKWQREARAYRDRYRGAQFESQHKIAFRAFKEGDLALFLPTRNQVAQRSWAAFNVGAPHYFLREQDKHRLNTRDWLLARITNIEEKVVDLSKSTNSKMAAGISEDGQSLEDDNPFGLSDGLRWYYLDAEEERMGPPIAPAPAKATVASDQFNATGSIERKKAPEQGVAARVLTKSLDSRRSSGNSRKSLLGVIGSPKMPAEPTDTEDRASLRPTSAAAVVARPTSDEVDSAPQSPSPSRSPQRQPGKDSVWAPLFSLDVALNGTKKK